MPLNAHFRATITVNVFSPAESGPLNDTQIATMMERALTTEELVRAGLLVSDLVVDRKPDAK